MLNPTVYANEKPLKSGIVTEMKELPYVNKSSILLAMMASVRRTPFLANRTNDRAYTILQCCVRRGLSSVVVCNVMYCG